MPPRYSYWTILAGGLPTAFRAAEREELLPTFQRLREKHPDAEMKWFAKGKLWDSPEDAKRADDRAAPRSGAANGERRGRDWRPGGTHRDPRQPFIDAKKARNSKWRQERFDRRQRNDAGPADHEARPPRETPGGRDRQDRPPRWTENRGATSRGDQRERPKGSERPRADREGREQRPRSDHRNERTQWGDRPPRGSDTRSQRPPSAPGDRPSWHDRPPREKDARDNRARPERPHWNDGVSREKDGRGGRPPRDARGDKPAWKDSAPGRKDWRDERPRNRDARPSGKPAGAPFAPNAKGRREEWRERPHGDRDQRQERPRDQRGPGRSERDRFNKPGPAGWPKPSDRPGGRNRPPARTGGGDHSFRERPLPTRDDRPRSSDRGDWRSDQRPRGDRPRSDWHGDKSGGNERGFDNRGKSDARSRDRFSDDRGSNARPPGARGPQHSRDRSPKGSGAGRRPFDRAGFDRPARGGDSETPAPPKRPNREPRPNENPEPTPPPRPSEPRITPPGPPERGRGDRFRRR